MQFACSIYRKLFFRFFENEGRYEERGRMNEIECTEPQRKQGRESMKEMEGLIKNPVCGKLPILILWDLQKRNKSQQIQ